MKYNRRTFFKNSLNTFAVLPFLNSFLLTLMARSEQGFADELTDRFLTFSFPNGCPFEWWNFENALAPLENYKDDIIIFSGLKNRVAEIFPADPHQQGASSLFVGSPIQSDFVGGGISIDQLLSKKLNLTTKNKIPFVAGVYRNISAGVSLPVTFSRRSWLENGNPARIFADPRTGFNNIFGIPELSSNLLVKNRKSILDLVVNDYKSLLSSRSQIPGKMKNELEKVLDNFRSTEEKINRFQNESLNICRTSYQQPDSLVNSATGVLDSENLHAAFELHIDTMIASFQCGITNTGSLMFCGAAENLIVAGMEKDDHNSSHYQTQMEKNQYLSYRKFHANVLAGILNRLDRAGLLNHTTILAATEIGDGNSHEPSQPHLVFSRKDNFKTGLALNASTYTTNGLYRTLLHKFGMDIDVFGHPRVEQNLIVEI